MRPRRAPASDPTPSEATVQWPLSEVPSDPGPAGPSLACGTPSMLVRDDASRSSLSDHLGNSRAQKHL